MNYSAAPDRYEGMLYRRCGNSGLMLPAISLGLWHNFGLTDDLQKCKDIILTAFDQGVSHFDLANNYGPPPGGAETVFGKILKENLSSHRDELIISSKAGWPMWPGPYGDWGSRKHLIASLDQSLKRMGIDYVDIYYHHRPDPQTPLEESMGALEQIVRSGKALYVGISSYSAEETTKAAEILESLGVPLLIHQPKYSMLERWVEDGLLEVVEEKKTGCIAFSSLAQGLLTDKYLNGVPADSRAASNRGNGALEAAVIDPATISKVRKLNDLAKKRNQSLAQMAVAWVLKDPRMTSVIIGASKPEHVSSAIASLSNLTFSDSELNEIDKILED